MDMNIAPGPYASFPTDEFRSIGTSSQSRSASIGAYSNRNMTEKGNALKPLLSGGAPSQSKVLRGSTRLRPQRGGPVRPRTLTFGDDALEATQGHRHDLDGSVRPFTDLVSLESQQCTDEEQQSEERNRENDERWSTLTDWTAREEEKGSTLDPVVLPE
jgi:hypothetical protein